jgi:hypothetical protein
VKLWLLISFLAVGSFSRADQLGFQSSDVSFIAGYTFASIYDTNKANRSEYYVVGDTMPHINNKTITMHHVGWKVGLGLLAGLGVAIGSSGGIEPFQFRDIVMGGLGGITCVVIHF